MAATLFVVATPIGNLEDITLRALRTLREVDLIAAEDTRRTAKLLTHYEISKPMLSVREHNEARQAARLVGEMREGRSIALVTDAGTPGIADPGARLVRGVREAGFPIVPIPGPSAVVAALPVSGFDASEFACMGFPPSSGNEREKWFDRLGRFRGPVVFFESPHRIQRTLSDLGARLVDRPIHILREMTKVHEELVVWDNTVDIRALGEFAIAVGPAIEEHRSFDQSDVASMFGRLTDGAGLSELVAENLTASLFGVEARDVRRAVKRQRILVKQQIAHPS